MSASVKGFLTGVAIMAPFVAFVIFCAWQAWKMLKREESARRATVERRVLKWEDIPGGKLVTLECGHTITWQMCYPNSCPCGQCSAEVQALKQMAGEK